MAKPDSFTLHRLAKFARTFRDRAGQLPTLGDFEKEGFAPELVEQAVRNETLEALYVTLTTGAIVKGYKAREP